MMPPDFSRVAAAEIGHNFATFGANADWVSSHVTQIKPENAQEIFYYMLSGVIDDLGVDYRRTSEDVLKAIPVILSTKPGLGLSVPLLKAASRVCDRDERFYVKLIHTIFNKAKLNPTLIAPDMLRKTQGHLQDIGSKTVRLKNFHDCRLAVEVSELLSELPRLVQPRDYLRLENWRSAGGHLTYLSITSTTLPARKSAVSTLLKVADNRNLVVDSKGREVFDLFAGAIAEVLSINFKQQSDRSYRHRAVDAWYALKPHYARLKKNKPSKLHRAAYWLTKLQSYFDKAPTP